MSERKMILKMLNEGKITLEEADALLEAMELDQLKEVEDDPEALKKAGEELEMEEDKSAEEEKTEPTGSEEPSGSEDDQNYWEKEVKKDLKGAKKDLEKGLDDLKKGFKNIKKNFKKEDFHEIKSALGDIADQINEGVHEVKDNINKNKGNGKGFSIDLDGVKDFVGNIVKSIGIGPGITIEDKFRGKFAAEEGPVQIDLQTKNGRVELVGWDEDEYEVHLKYNIHASSEEEAHKIKEDMCEITQEDDLLKIETNKLVRGGVSIRVYIPQELKSNIKLRSSNGRLGLSNLKTEGDYDLKTSNGRIQLGDLRAEKIIAKTSNGRIEVEDYAAEHINLKSSNGSIYADGLCNDIVIRTSNGTISAYPYISEKGQMDLKTSNGKVKVILKNPDTAVDINAETSMGKITFEIPELVYKEKIDKHMKKRYQAHSDNYIDSSERLQIQAETSMGSIFVGQYED